MPSDAKMLTAGRPGTEVWVRGTVRTLGSESVEIQFANYSLWIPLKDIRLSAERDTLERKE